MKSKETNNVLIILNELYKFIFLKQVKSILFIIIVFVSCNENKTNVSASDIPTIPLNDVDICKCLTEPGNSAWFVENETKCNDTISKAIGVVDWRKVNFNLNLQANIKFDSLKSLCKKTEIGGQFDNNINITPDVNIDPLVRIFKDSTAINYLFNNKKVDYAVIRPITSNKYDLRKFLNLKIDSKFSNPNSDYYPKIVQSIKLGFPVYEISTKWTQADWIENLKIYVPHQYKYLYLLFIYEGRYKLIRENEMSNDPYLSNFIKEISVFSYPYNPINLNQYVIEIENEKTWGDSKNLNIKTDASIYNTHSLEISLGKTVTLSRILLNTDENEIEKKSIKSISTNNSKESDKQDKSEYEEIAFAPDDGPIQAESVREFVSEYYIVNASKLHLVSVYQGASENSTQLFQFDSKERVHALKIENEFANIKFESYKDFKVNGWVKMSDLKNQNR